MLKLRGREGRVEIFVRKTTGQEPVLFRGQLVKVESEYRQTRVKTRIFYALAGQRKK